MVGTKTAPPNPREELPKAGLRAARAGLRTAPALRPEVVPDTTAPQVSVSAVPRRVEPNQSVALSVHATDDAEVVELRLEIDGVPVALNDDDRATFTSDVPGVHRIVARAVDSSGNTGSVELTIGVADSADTEPPILSVSAPVADDEWTYLHDVIGTVADANLLEHRVELRRVGSEAWTTLSVASAPASNAVLARLDTTLLENGYHELRLTAQDANGLESELVVPFRVGGQAKPGVVQLDIVDMAVSMAGIPITVVRSFTASRMPARRTRSC